MPLEIKATSPFDPAVSRLIDELDHYQQSLYPAESNHLDSRETLAAPNCKLLGAFVDGQLVGIGAAKIRDDFGELKRFYVSDRHRGQGIAERIAAALESWLLENGILKSFLETGIHQPAALAFYRRLGYEPCGPFGDYKDDPLSVFMVKRLAKNV